MSVSVKHVLEQGPVLRALSGVALSVLRKSNKSAGATPGSALSHNGRAPTAPMLGSGRGSRRATSCARSSGRSRA